MFNQTIGPVNSGPQSFNPQVLSGHQPSSPVNSGHPSFGPHLLQQIRQQQPLGVRSPVASQGFVPRGPPLGPGGTQAPRPSNPVSIFY